MLLETSSRLVLDREASKAGLSHSLSSRLRACGCCGTLPQQVQWPERVTVASARLALGKGKGLVPQQRGAVVKTFCLLVNHSAMWVDFDKELLTFELRVQIFRPGVGRKCLHKSWTERSLSIGLFGNQLSPLSKQRA